jgi:hypothetical protein
VGLVGGIQVADMTGMGRSLSMSSASVSMEGVGLWAGGTGPL